MRAKQTPEQRADYKRKWAAANREQRNERARERRLRDPEWRAERNKYRSDWEQKNRDKVNTSVRKAYTKDVEIAREKQRERYKRKPAEQLQKTAANIKLHRAGNPKYSEEAMRAYAKQWRGNNPAQAKSTATRNYHKDPSRKLWLLARQRANKRGLEFNIEPADVVVPDTCPVFGIKIVSGPGIALHDNTPTLDRIDNAKGYVKGNVLVVSFRANRLKSNATAAELRTLADFYEALA